MTVGKKPKSASVQRTFRIPSDHDAELERLAAAQGTTFAALVRKALRQYVERDRQTELLEGLEERIVATMSRLTREQRTLRNDVHLGMAMTDTLAQVYLLHTPPLPPEAVESASASAHERHEKFTRRVVSQLQGGEGLWTALADAPGGTADGDET